MTLMQPTPIQLKEVMLEGELVIPDHAKALVIIADDEHRKAGCRKLARELSRHNFASLLTSLLTPDEASGQHADRLRCDVAFLSQRLQEITTWARNTPDIERFMVGYLTFGPDFAAALVEAARHQDIIGAVVAYNGRTDLAERYLPFVRRPVLLIVSGHDSETLAINREGIKKLNSHCQLHTIDAGTDLFDSSALSEAIKQAASWFDKYLH